MRRICILAALLVIILLLSSCYRSHGFTRDVNTPMSNPATESTYYPLR